MDDILATDEGPVARDEQRTRDLGACVALRDHVRDLLVEIKTAREWQMSPGTAPNIVYGTFARGTKTYRAALLLADRGYGEQAGMLNRSLFEHAVVAWWLLLQPDEEDVMRRIRAHRQHAQVLYDRHSALHPELALDDEQEGAQTLDEARVEELDKLFGYHGHKHWTGLTLAGIVEQVEDGWDEPYGGLLWEFLRIVNSWNNSMLHHSAMGVIQGVEWPDSSETPVLKLGPSPEWQQAALFASYWSYGMLVLAAMRCGSDERRPAMREFLDGHGRDFRELTEEEKRGVGRNDPCPCGSRKKFKRCHG
jgi:Family of unknown function (DUF5677)/SEC-C motif